MSVLRYADDAARGGLTLVNYLDNLTRSAPEAKQAVRQVLDSIQYNVPENILPIDLIASGRLSSGDMTRLLAAREGAGSTFVDYAKDVHTLARLSPEELAEIAKYRNSPEWVPRAHLVEEDYAKNYFANNPEAKLLYPRIRPSEVPLMSDAIREMSVRSMLARDYDLDTPLTVFRDYNYMGVPSYSPGALSVTTNPRMKSSHLRLVQAPSGKSKKRIAFTAKPRDVLTDASIQNVKIADEEELQFLRENLNRITSLNSDEQAIELIRRGMA